MSDPSPIDLSLNCAQSRTSIHRVAPWLLMIGLPILLISLLAIGLLGAPVAQAAASVSVCASGGATYTTVQEGVNNVDPGGEVVICTGVYSESVNLSLMGSAIGGNVGNVTLRAQSGAVTVDPLSGPALYISGTFTGSITIDGLDVTSGDSNGMMLGSQFNAPTGQVSGTVSILNSTANAASNYGIEINATGAISVVNSQAISNYRGGFYLTGLQIVQLDTVTASENGQSGFQSELDSGVIFGPPFDGLSSCLDPATPIEVRDTTADGNDGYGIAVGSPFLRVGYPVVLANVQTNGNGMDGVSLHSYCSVDVSNVQAGQNTMNGFTLAGLEGVTVSAGTSATGNDLNGFCLFREFEPNGRWRRRHI